VQALITIQQVMQYGKFHTIRIKLQSYFLRIKYKLLKLAEVSLSISKQIKVCQRKYKV